MNSLTGSLLALYNRFPRIRLFILMIFLFVIFSIISSVLMVSKDVKTEPIGWDRAKIISPAGITAKNVHVDQKNNLVAAVFEGVSGGRSRIYISLSFDEGNNFLDPIKLAEFSSEINNNPRVAVSSQGKIFVTWYLLSDDEATSQIYCISSEDMGLNWSQPVRVTFGMQMEMLPEPFFDDRGLLHIFFTSYKDNTFNLFHTTRNEKNINEKDITEKDINEKDVFDKPNQVLKMSGNIKGTFFPAIKFIKNNIVLVCQRKETDYTDHLFFTSSGNYGRSWSGVDKITKGRSNNQSPSIEVYDGTIYLVYMNNSDRNWNIGMLKGYSLGKRWDTEPVKVSSTNVNCYSPNIVTSSDNELFISWHDLREGGSRIFYRKYSVKGKELLSEGKLSVKQQQAKNPICINTGTRLIVLWEEGNRIVGNASDNYVAVPTIYVSSHPEDSWSRENAALIKWTKPVDESGIAGYAIIVDKNPYSDPAIQNQSDDALSMLISGLDDGITYFHIRAIDGAGNMSRTVHYKLQVSANPLSMPVVVSTTHPENGKSDLSDAVFRWAVNDSRRLKGFLYSFSKDVAYKPDKFIKDFEIKFDNLEQGVYFFNIASVSATNQISRVSTYCFIVSDGVIDQDYLNQIANMDYNFGNMGGGGTREAVYSYPSLEINLPFGNLGRYSGNNFTALLKPLNIPAGNVSGYSVIVDNNRKDPPGKVNLMSEILNIADLSRGDYTIAAKCRYFKIIDNKRVYFWTAPVYKTFTIVPSAVNSPVNEIYGTLDKKFNDSPYILSLIVVLFSMVIIYKRYRPKIIFYIKLINHKLKFYFAENF
ncbi:MAG: exo-alpha-sialidase [Leptospirales bacterium]|nr:exo-alpha-sialidase [Leptospirales bacterium]